MRTIYLAHGCKRHELLLPFASRKKYLPFHRDLDRLNYVEQLSFADVQAFERFLATMDAEPVARSATARYTVESGVRNCAFTLLTLDG